MTLLPHIKDDQSERRCNEKKDLVSEEAIICHPSDILRLTLYDPKHHDYKCTVQTILSQGFCHPIDILRLTLYDPKHLQCIASTLNIHGKC